MTNTSTKAKVYNFHVNGEQGTYEVVFHVDDDNIESTCTCNYNSEKKLCWHRYYVLAGKSQRLENFDTQLQQDLIYQLSKTEGGRELVSHAKATFGEKETCRRCNKSEVVDLKKGLTGKFLGIFVPKGRRYFCWSCRWSW